MHLYVKCSWSLPLALHITFLCNCFISCRWKWSQCLPLVLHSLLCSACSIPC